MVSSIALLALVGAWAGDGAAASTAAEPEPVEAIAPGLGFEGVAKRERAPLRERFDEALGQACEPPPCVSGKCSADEPTLGVVVEGVERDYTLRWQATDPRLDQPLELESSCELCNLVELQDRLAGDLGTLCKRLASVGEGPGRVRLTSDPSGATVRVDGKRVGRTPWVGELEPGEHAVELRAPGYVNETRTLTMVGGLEELEHVELMAMTGGRRRPFWPAWTSIGVGVALGVVGTALIAIDGKEWEGRCSGTNVDPLGNCRYVHATGELGISLAAIGAASFGAGVGLMIWAQRGRGHGGGLAVRGSF